MARDASQVEIGDFLPLISRFSYTLSKLVRTAKETGIDGTPDFLKAGDPGEIRYSTSGIAYSISPPHTMKEAIVDPIHVVIYLIFTLSACRLKDQQMIVDSHREGSELKRIIDIPTRPKIPSAAQSLQPKH
ncbi:hypothetical protein DFH07DRAFT_988976 [Mycena maculata]|uniref:Uncharacterized protein n=1 Tax=Mycena maculata TaxID=230809 RepID=A0AAD7I3H5_9AGAR|nr:hypothetical protein DFH07DRAFT_970713 [Mycena maculata]KAJ7734326.1 hypothetical protein DFH07DRAFT_988976 [Mycena maculata]